MELGCILVDDCFGGDVGGAIVDKDGCCFGPGSGFVLKDAHGHLAFVRELHGRVCDKGNHIS